MNITTHFEPSRRSQKARLARTLRALPLAPESWPYASVEIVPDPRSKPRLSAKEVAAGLGLLARGFSGAEALAALLAGRAFLASFPSAGGGR